MTAAKRLTLTFDNGPWPEATAGLLDELGRRDLKATFFVVGARMAEGAAREQAERAHAEGHWIGNHTLTHGPPLGLVDDAVVAQTEIAAAQSLLGGLAHPDKLFRPNGRGRLGRHLLSAAAVRLLETGGYTVVTWNNVPGDWIEPKRDWVDRALATLDAQDWSLLVVHDHNLVTMPETLPRFLDAVLERGVEVVQDFPPECVPIRRGVAQPGLVAVATI